MGQIFRILIIAIAIWLAVLLVRRALRAGRPEKTHTPPSPPRMLPCAACGVHVPETDALIQGGRTYCCKEHLPLGDS